MRRRNFFALTADAAVWLIAGAEAQQPNERGDWVTWPGWAASFTTCWPLGPSSTGLVVFDPLKPVGGIETVIPELAESWGVGREWDQAAFQAAPRRQMAWRQAFHCQGCAVHLALAQRQIR